MKTSIRFEALFDPPDPNVREPPGGAGMTAVAADETASMRVTSAVSADASFRRAPFRKCSRCGPKKVHSGCATSPKSCPCSDRLTSAAAVSRRFDILQSPSFDYEARNPEPQ